jgi:hypothetical protein
MTPASCPICQSILSDKNGDTRPWDKMSYKRPVNKSPLSKAEKLDLLKHYNEYYRNLVANDRSALNRKVPREAFNDLIGGLGEKVLAESARLASTEGPIRTFLDDNPLTPPLARRLPDDFRVFCLALNALKQWVVAEQAAGDRYLLGGGARDLCREATDRCLVSGEALDSDCELHHTVRDGRPPIPLNKSGHASIEGQLSFEGDDPTERALRVLRSGSNRSWALLRRGCLDLLGRPVPWSSKSSEASARAFARKAHAVANLGYEQIIDWMNKKGL